MKSKFIGLGLFLGVLASPLTNVSAVWQPTEKLSDPAIPVTEFGGPVLAVSPQGNAVAVWTNEFTFEPVDDTSIISSFYTRGIGWSAPQIISSLALNSADNFLYTSQGDPDVAMNSSDYAVAVWEGIYSDLINDPAMIFSAVRNNGVWGPVQFVSEYTDNIFLNRVNANVAVNDAGTAIAAWKVVNEDNGDETIEVSFLPFGGVWTAPVVISSPAQESDGATADRKPYVVINERGDAAVIWWGRFPTDRQIVAATYNSLTATWSAPITLDTGTGFALSSNPRIGIDENGNVAAIWQNTTNVKTAFFTNGIGWGPSQTLATNGATNTANIIMDAAGNTTAMWTNTAGINVGQIVTAFRPVNGVWGAPEIISTGTSNLSGPFMSQEDLAVDAEGNVIAVWINTTDDTVMSAFHPFGFPWRPEELVSPITPSEFVSIGLASCGFAVALWQETEGQDEVYAAVNENLLAPQSASFTNSCEVRFITQSRFLSILNWVPISPDCIVAYRIYCNGVLIAEVPGTDAFEFLFPRCCRRNPCSFTITSINIWGFESDPIPVALIG